MMKPSIEIRLIIRQRQRIVQALLLMMVHHPDATGQTVGLLRRVVDSVFVHSYSGGKRLVTTLYPVIVIMFRIK